MRKRRIIHAEIDPDEILLDASNLPQFDTQQFEGRIEKAISKRAILFLTLMLFLGAVLYLYRLASLQIIRSEAFAARSEDNSLRRVPVLSERGVIQDRNGELLAWNNPATGRDYAPSAGLSTVIGYLGYPTIEEAAALPIADPHIRVGKMGVEKAYDTILQGAIGVRVEEVDSAGRLVSENTERLPRDGKPLTLALDARLQGELYKVIEGVAKDRGFAGGAGVVMDVHTGEILTMVSYPEFPLSAATGSSSSSLAPYLTDTRRPFLNRAVSGLYTPGSIVKPFMALAALQEKVISPERQILSTGSIKIENPFVPDTYTVFKDWKAHGLVDMRHALSVSSNVYFYEIGGGFEKQKGLGITRIDKYADLFGFGRATGIDIPGEQSGTVPSPDWKQEVFGEDWRLGDTYHTSIGQYGFQVTPLQMARAIGAIANGGLLLTPHLERGGVVAGADELPINPEHYKVVREGMRLSATEGTAVALNVPYVKFGGKTGTAELGEQKSNVNSWVEGFFPYDKPQYSFAIVMEKGRVGNTIGASAVARQFFDWMSIYTPEYFEFTP